MADLYANSATVNRPRRTDPICAVMQLPTCAANPLNKRPWDHHRLPRYRSAQSIQYDGATIRKAKGTQDQLVPCTAQHQFAMANILTHPGA